MHQTTPIETSRTQDYRSKGRRRAMWRPALVGAVLGAGALAVAAPPVGAAQHTVVERHVAASHKVAVRVATVSKYGKVLVDQKGLALYYDTANKPRHWACKGSCLSLWPPLVLPKGQKVATAGKGVSGLGVVNGPSGRQVTWHGKALYTYIRDSKGKALGEGLFHIWYLAETTTKNPVTKTTKPATTTTTTKTSATWA